MEQRRLGRTGVSVSKLCLLDAGLLDEILVHVAPVLLGDGVRLFDHPGGAPIRLEPIAGTPPVTNLWMRPSR
jgi:dihydrofolate reductase